MTDWKLKIHGIKSAIDRYAETDQDLLHGEERIENVGALATIVHDILTAHRPLVVRLVGEDGTDIEEFDERVDEFHTLAYIDGSRAKEQDFDAVMSALYDWADDNKVWLEWD